MRQVEQLSIEAGDAALAALVAPAVGGAPELADEDLDAATRAIAAQLAAADDAVDLDEVNRLEAWLWLDCPASPEGRVGGAARQLVLDMNRIALAGDSGYRGDSGIDAWARLEEVTCPMLVAWGELEVPAMAEQYRVVAERIPGARALVIDGVAHLPSVERPRDVARLVRDAMSPAR